MLYEAVAGRLPFIVRADDRESLLSMHCSRNPIRLSALLPRIEPSLEAVVMKAMEKNPDMRYQHAAIMGQALENCIYI